MFLTKSSKSPFYQLVYTAAGRRTTISTKTKYKQEAEQFLLKFNLGIHEETTSLKPIRLSKFRDEYERYITQSKTKSYLRSVKISFTQLIDFTGDIAITRIDTRLIDQFITSTYARTEFGAALFYRTLKAAFSKAVVWNFIKDNPFKKIKSPKVYNKLPAFINEDEFQLIIANTKEKFLIDLFTAAFYTGMRLGELVNMKWGWIDHTKRMITIKCTSEFITKAKRERVIPISSKLNSILVVGRKSDNYIFTKVQGIRLNEDYVSKKFKKAVLSTRLSNNIHFHSLRHSFASNLVQKGASLYVVKELMGHQNLTTTQIYSHLNSQNLLEAVNLL